MCMRETGRRKCVYSVFRERERDAVIGKSSHPYVDPDVIRMLKYSDFPGEFYEPLRARVSCSHRAPPVNAIHPPFKHNQSLFSLSFDVYLLLLPTRTLLRFSSCDGKVFVGR